MAVDFTVFTPTYNRAYTLKNSYEALCGQTCKEFIWLIVDDGSTDDTKELIETWIAEGNIQIEYVFQANAGKQRAVNTGIQHCRTKYFGFLDSDDYYCPETVEKFLQIFSEIEHDQSVAGILARRGHDQTTPLGSANLPKGRYVMNFDALIRKYHFYGDTCRAYKTDILRNFLYPEIQDKFILESVMLSAIDQKYDLMVVNEVFSISAYLSDGYTQNSYRLYQDNPYGYALGVGVITAAKRGFLRQVKYTLLFSVWCRRHQIKDAYEIVRNKRLYVLLKPFSMLCYLLKYPGWMFEQVKK